MPLVVLGNVFINPLMYTGSAVARRAVERGWNVVSIRYEEPLRFDVFAPGFDNRDSRRGALQTAPSWASKVC